MFPSEKGEHIFKISEDVKEKVRKASMFPRFQTKESEKGEHISKISD